MPRTVELIDPIDGTIEMVGLTVAPDTALLDRARAAFAPLRPPGPIRRGPAPSEAGESEAAACHAHLAGRTWRHFSVDDAAVVLAHHPCVTRTEWLAAMPEIMELVLCADGWARAFDSLALALRFDSRRPQRLEEVPVTPEMAAVMAAFLDALLARHEALMPVHDHETRTNLDRTRTWWHQRAAAAG